MQNQPLTSVNTFPPEEESIDLKKIFMSLADKWPLFLISVLICIIGSYIYSILTPPTFVVNARVLVHNEDKGGMGKQAGALMDFSGLLGASNSVDNEAEILKTRFLMEQVVRKMQLNIIYKKRLSLVEREIYHAPFVFEISKSVDTIKHTKLLVSESGKNNLVINGKKLEIRTAWGLPFKVPGVGSVVIKRGDFKKPLIGSYIVEISSIDERVSVLMKDLTIGVSNKQVSIIDLSLNYGLQKKGEDILNTLISQYITSNLTDKNTIADSTTKFIKERLAIIGNELGDVEDDVEGFKRTNSLSDMSEQSKLLVQNSSEFASELAKAETQITILSDLETYLKDESKNKRVFPSALLPSDMVFSQLMNQYNSLLIERDKQLLGVTEQSPFIKNIDSQILEFRKGILANIQSTKNTYVVTRNKLKAQLAKTDSQISGVPQIEKNYLKLARNKQIKEELYIFLMQKAEETAISKTSNISVAKTIDPPKAELAPVKPKKTIIVFAGFIAGLILPAAYLFTRNLLNTTITTKEDITNRTQVPVIGEISHNVGNDNLIVANKGRSAISEQFRALRTNLSFYLKTKDEKVILLTSSMSGEGKSFTAINLASIFALSGKKVLMMELDLRKPGLSTKLNIKNQMGFSNFTINTDLKVDDIIIPLSFNSNMFLISSGPLPPNPAETLMSAHTANLIAELKKKFDYIIIDAPPVGIITDAQLLAEYADVTIYLVRQKITLKEHLSIVDGLYKSNKMKNLAIVVNDIVSKVYGYGYGYGSYGEERNLTFFEKLSNIFK